MTEAQICANELCRFLSKLSNKIKFAKENDIAFKRASFEFETSGKLFVRAKQLLIKCIFDATTLKQRRILLESHILNTFETMKKYIEELNSVKNIGQIIRTIMPNKKRNEERENEMSLFCVFGLQSLSQFTKNYKQKIIVWKSD